MRVEESICGERGRSWKVNCMQSSLGTIQIFIIMLKDPPSGVMIHRCQKCAELRYWCWHHRASITSLT